MQIITDTAALEKLSARLADAPFITVDTEFMREKTYWPKLCLIQAASEDDEAIIDTLAEGLDLGPFLDVLKDDSVLKVFHAARQDIEIFYHMTGGTPRAIFDTQIAAMVCGFGDSVAYDTLARALAGAHVDKASRFTDWGRRPLTDAQLQYALNDVTHLRLVYRKLKDRLDQSGRADWLSEELNLLTNPATYALKPETAWKRLKLKGMRKKQLGVLIELAAWREREAQTRDVPRARIMKDEGLYEIARAQPQSQTDLSRLRSIPRGYEKSDSAGRLLEAVGDGLETPLDDLPETENNRGPRQSAPGSLVELLKVLLKKQSDELGIAPKLIATSADIEALAAGRDNETRALHGWRRDVFGDLALKLKAGDIALKAGDSSVQIVELDKR